MWVHYKSSIIISEHLLIFAVLSLIKISNLPLLSFASFVELLTSETKQSKETLR